MDKLFLYCANSNLVYKLFTDGDGLSDGAEVLKYGTDPLNPDTDGDGLIDGYNRTHFGRISWGYVDSSLYQKNFVKINGDYVGEMSIGTDPFIADTDGDGINDGAEVENLSMLKIPANLWSGILYSKDYDGDGLPDSYELRMAYGANTTNKSAWNEGRYLNVTNSTDAYLDFDSDGLTNLEEYQRDPSGDYDHDGTPDIYDTDDDNDTIPTSVELQNHLDPFNPADAAGDLDHDGLNNSFEYHHGLNMQDPDTDHDGINDGAELNYWESRLSALHPAWSEEQVLNMSINYTLNPDVDRDNITDGKEINGYDVKIITGWKSDGTPISEMRYISPTELDPLMPYANSTGVWTDTDGDGIPDVVEAMLSNTSYWRFLVVEYPLLWAQYSWAAKYYDTIKNKENETAAKQWLHDQFNPLIVDHTPPIITKFKLTWIIVTDSNFPYVHLYAHVHVSVRDVGRIEWVNVTDKNNGDVWANYVDETYFEDQHNFSASLLSDGITGSVRINLTTYDHAGNYFYGEKKLDGLVNASLNALAALWEQFWATLVEVGKAVQKAVNWILQYVESIIRSVLEKAFSPLISIAEWWVKEIGVEVAGILFGSSKSFDKLKASIVRDSESDSEQVRNLISTLFSGKVVMLCMAAAIAVSSLASLVGIYMDIFTGGANEIISVTVLPVLQEMMINFLKNTVLSMALTNGLIVSVMGLLTYLIPQNSPVWGDILPVVQVITSYYFSKQIGESMIFGVSGEISWDWFGLTLALIGLVMDFAISTLKIASWIAQNLNLNNEQTKIVKVSLYAVGAAIAIVGFLRTLKMDPIDMFIGGPLSMLEEILSLMTVVTIGVNIGLALSS